MATLLGAEWIDWERERLRAWTREARRWVAPFLVGAALAGLALVALRGNILQMRYQLDAAYRHESELAKETATLAGRYWELRDPSRLGQKAGHAFSVPSCVARVRPDGSRPHFDPAECGR